MPSATIQSVISLLATALNEAYLMAGTPNPAQQIAILKSEKSLLTSQVNQLGADLATRTQERDARQAVLVTINANAQARKTADAAKVDGQDVIDLTQGFVNG